MNKDEIFEMARQAGFEGCAELTWEDVICTEELVAFAKLVAATEREACAKEVENALYGQEGCGKAAKAIRAIEAAHGIKE